MINGAEDRLLTIRRRAVNSRSDQDTFGLERDLLQELTKLIAAPRSELEWYRHLFESTAFLEAAAELVKIADRRLHASVTLGIGPATAVVGDRVEIACTPALAVIAALAWTLTKRKA